MTAAYDPNNIFAKILRGEIPCHKVYEDDAVLAFMDVMPQSDGHTLVVPKSAARNILDASAEQLAVLMPVVQKIARAVIKAFAADGAVVMQFNEEPAGQTVFHLHFHVIPRKEGEPLKPHSGAMADGEVLKAHAEKIKAALAS